MTDLHFALLAIAAVLIVGLFAYGKWQERQAARRIDVAMRDGVGDPLAESMIDAPGGRQRRIEPRLGIELGPVADEVDLPSAADESSTTSTSAPERSEPSAYGLADGWIEDPMLDFVLELRCTHPIDGVAAIEARGHLDRLELPLPTHLAVWDPRSQRWSGPDRFGFYSEMLVAVQMATRKHSLGEIDAARFASAAQQIAMQLDADLDSPEISRLTSRAAELDRLCARFDVQITLTLEPTADPWTTSIVEAAARDLGFERREGPRWERGPEGCPFLALVPTGSPINRLSLHFDVPVVPAAAAPLALLFTSADQLAAKLHARIVDDNGRPIQPGAQAAIDKQLGALYIDMRGADIEPGSAGARRLFAA